jgi:predicted SAM-dependent methyltransferase
LLEGTGEAGNGELMQGTGAEAEARAELGLLRKNMKILDLGCGSNKLEGAVGVDSDPNSEADIIHDLNIVPYPFKNNEFGMVYSHHSLEHLENTEKVMQEIHRITKPGGKVRIFVPWAGNARAFGYQHKTFFTVDSMNTIPGFRIVKERYHYFLHGMPEKQSIFGKAIRVLATPIDWMINWNCYIYGKFLHNYIGDADEMEWELEVLK